MSWSSLGLDGRDDRLNIRALRALPPSRAGDDLDRRRVFTAALGQFDELLSASEAVGPASRPLTLYYALNQAGRAIAAARTPPGQPWRPKRHGLTIGEPPPDGVLQSVQITPQREQDDWPDSFRLLGRATNMATLTTATTLSRVWGAIPHLPSPGLGAGTDRPLLLEGPFDSATGTVTLVGWPPDPESAPRLVEWLGSHYPAAAEGLEVAMIVPHTRHFQGARIELRWRTPDGSVIPPRQQASRYLGADEHWLIPRVNSADEVLEPMMLWWALLHALSQLARYHPAEWTAALDPDSAWSTVPIERVLTLALDVVPRLVLLALAPGTAYPRPRAA